MKFLLVLLSSIALCAGSAIPLIPGDNSHYVEGESRFIWMPAADGTPVLVDLEAPVETDALRADSEDNLYYLYTRLNNDTYQELIFNNETSVLESNFDASKKTLIVTHGWLSSADSDINSVIREAALGSEDVNFIFMDWSSISSKFYTTASNQVPEIGENVGLFVQWLVELTSGDYNKIHLAGHSLGAHIMGTAGRTLNGTLLRVTGMDPAGPLWGDNEDALNNSSAQYVEAIHTDAGWLGIKEPIGTSDFYPNGGAGQPGCILSTCNHSRSWYYFAATLEYDFVANKCADWDTALDEECDGEELLSMGNNDLSKYGEGIFGLTTTSSYPYYIADETESSES